MKVIDEDWRFFISNSTSLRVNISPDFTVATLDFIHFDMKTVPRTLRSIGQPRLPICLRFCGLGTYFSPWYIDTNDVLMQSISQANEVCIFIDKAWINFIIELNLKLRKLRRYSLSGDLAVFVQNLLEERLVGSLGGVITQFCCFLKPDKVTALHPSTLYLVGGSVLSPEREAGRGERHSLDCPTTPVAPFDADIKNTNMLSEFSSILNTTNNSSNPNLKTNRDYEPDSSDPFRNVMRTRETSHSTHEGEEDIIPVVSDIGEMKRPAGFGETCRLITDGEVFPGLIFFHESTPVEDVVHDADEDEEDNLANNANIMLSLTHGDAQKNAVKLDNSRDSDKYGEGARDVYGDKVDELDKFYKILANADERNTVHSDFPAYQSDGESLYRSESGSHNLSARNRTESHHTNDSSEMASHVSSDYVSDYGIKDLRTSLSHSPLTVGRFHKSSMYHNVIQIWSWSCKSAKPMLLTKQVYSNCNSVSNLKIMYPTTIEVIGETLSNFFRCETILRKRKYTTWEHVVKFTAMINRIISHGTNKLPRSKMFHHLMTALFFLFIFLDIGCTCFVTLSYWCVWGNRTSCDNHTGVVLIQLVWPGALIMAPLMGLRVMILNSTGTIARQYVCWSRFACINCIMMVVIYLKWTENANTFLNIPILIAYAGSRLFQNYYFDSLIATTENVRTSRGWNGLHTSIPNFENHEFS
jgi:hypothetical protein